MMDDATTTTLEPPTVSVTLSNDVRKMIEETVNNTMIQRIDEIMTARLREMLPQLLSRHALSEELFGKQQQQQQQQRRTMNRQQQQGPDQSFSDFSVRNGIVTED